MSKQHYKGMVADEVRLLDLRRQTQIANQVESIDRILDGATYDDEMRTLQESLAAVTVERDEARAEVERIRHERGLE